MFRNENFSEGEIIKASLPENNVVIVSRIVVHSILALKTYKNKSSILNFYLHISNSNMMCLGISLFLVQYIRLTIGIGAFVTMRLTLMDVLRK